MRSLGVVIPCFNAGEWLAECVASLTAQSIVDWRALIVDDASDDGKSEALARAQRGDRVESVRLSRNVGQSAARNFGLRHFSEVEWLLTLDADDWLAPDYLERLLAAARREPFPAASFGTQVFVGERPFRTATGTWPESEFDPARRFLENFLPGGGVLWRADVLRSLGGWRRSYAGLFEDWEIGLRLHSRGLRHAWVPAASYHYRQHGGSALHRWDRYRSARFDAKLLRDYSGEIEVLHGRRAFASRRLAPELRAALRRAELRRATRLLADLGLPAALRLAPALLVARGAA